MRLNGGVGAIGEWLIQSDVDVAMSRATPLGADEVFFPLHFFDAGFMLSRRKVSRQFGGVGRDWRISHPIRCSCGDP